jgi:hypothetical protein
VGDWDQRGTRLEREAVYKGARCSLVADAFRETCCGEKSVGLHRSYLSVFTEAGHAEIVVSEPAVFRALDELAGEAIEDWQSELDEAFDECWEDR